MYEKRKWIEFLKEREREEQSLDWNSRKVCFLQREVQGVLQISSYPLMKNLGFIIVLPISSPVIIVDMLTIVFSLFRSPDHIPLFLNILNHQHSNINFEQYRRKTALLGISQLLFLP